MKAFRLLILLVLPAFVFSTCKKEDENRPPSKPKLLEPAQGSVVTPEKITFIWEESTDPEGEDVKYILNISCDSINWKEYWFDSPTSFVLGNMQTYSNYFPFETGKKYYWKVTAKSVDKNFNITGISESDIVSFYTNPAGVANLSKTSGDGFVNLTWTDPAGLSKVEVTFSPSVNGITQPITVNPGVSKLELQGMVNSTVYSFYVTAFNNMGHSSKVDTLKAMPLAPTLVHDADFNIYSTVQIGTQIWMRENLRTTKWQDGTEMKDHWGLMYSIADQSNVYGYYYNSPLWWNEKNPCPCGYHVPSDADVITLEKFLGMPEADLLIQIGNQNDRGSLEKVGSLIKSKTGWIDYEGGSGNGIDLYGLNIMPAGVYDMQTNKIQGSGFGVIIPTTTRQNSSIYDGVYIRLLYHNKEGITRWYYRWDGQRYTIRCLKD